MKTDDLVSMLARHPELLTGQAPLARPVAAFATAALVSTVLMVAALGLRPDLAQAAGLPMFWVKIAFPAAMALPALYACGRLAHPGMRARAALVVIVVALAAMTLLAAVIVTGAAPVERAALVFGTTWKSCLVNISWLSAPVFATLFWLMRGMAPTNQRLAGAACGLAAGGVAAVIYALHCPELAAPFVAIWYFLGMLIPTAAGAALGPRSLRW